VFWIGSTELKGGLPSAVRAAHNGGMAAFAGFSPDAMSFLLELRANNDRAWFQPRKAEYERLLKEPLEALCVALGEQFADRGIPLRADQQSPFRIYRDIRFSKDKSPYKTYVSASFPYVAGADLGGASHREHGVGAYFHLSPDETYAGGGMWHPERPRIEAWRSRVVDDTQAVHAALDDPGFAAIFGRVEGEALRRVPPGYPTDHPDADLLRLKEVVFGRRMEAEEAFAPDLAARLADTYAAAAPVLRLLASVPGS
jgi:uncharacterized protein (TIGR02453 family)